MLGMSQIAGKFKMLCNPDMNKGKERSEDGNDGGEFSLYTTHALKHIIVCKEKYTKLGCISVALLDKVMS